MDTLDHAAILARIASAPAPVIHARSLDELNHLHPLAEHFSHQRVAQYAHHYTTRETTP